MWLQEVTLWVSETPEENSEHWKPITFPMEKEVQYEKR